MPGDQTASGQNPKSLHPNRPFTRGQQRGRASVALLQKRSQPCGWSESPTSPSSDPVRWLLPLSGALESTQRAKQTRNSFAPRPGSERERFPPECRGTHVEVGRATTAGVISKALRRHGCDRSPLVYSRPGYRCPPRRPTQGPAAPWRPSGESLTPPHRGGVEDHPAGSPRVAAPAAMTSASEPTHAPSRSVRVAAIPIESRNQGTFHVKPLLPTRSSTPPFPCSDADRETHPERANVCAYCVTGRPDRVEPHFEPGTKVSFLSGYELRCGLLRPGSVACLHVHPRRCLSSPRGLAWPKDLPGQKRNDASGCHLVSRETLKYLVSAGKPIHRQLRERLGIS